MEQIKSRRKWSLLPALKAVLGIGDKQEEINEKEVEAFNKHVGEATQILEARTRNIESIKPEQTRPIQGRDNKTIQRPKQKQKQNQDIEPR